MASSQFDFKKPFRLESGKLIENFHLGYSTFGELNETKSNAVWIFHAYTANSNPLEWWPGLVGHGKTIDLDKYFIICVNMPGSCYGSSGPMDINPATGTPYFHDFPLVTIKDMIRAYDHLRKDLGIEKIYMGIGGSMGGQQLLEWAAEQPELFEIIIPIATNAQHSPWGIAHNTSQRWVIENDPTWGNPTENAGQEGLKIARGMALLTYRNYKTFDQTQKGLIEDCEMVPVDKQKFRASSYLNYQGEKFIQRFNAYSYHILTQVMDTHDMGRGRGGTDAALEIIQSRALVMGVSSDILFPIEEQKYLANNLKKGKLAVIDSLYGHDGFLLEYEAMGYHIEQFLNERN